LAFVIPEAVQATSHLSSSIAPFLFERDIFPPFVKGVQTGYMGLFASWIKSPAAPFIKGGENNLFFLSFRKSAATEKS
jgi:hypothetical protein